MWDARGGYGINESMKIHCPLNSHQTALTQYTVTMASGVMKRSDNLPFPALSGATYTYKVLDKPPAISSYQGKNEFFFATNVTLVLTFNEPVQAGTGNIILTPNPCSSVWGSVIESRTYCGRNVPSLGIYLSGYPGNW